VLSWRDFSGLVRAQIILADELHTVCGDCEWSTLCQSKTDGIFKNRELP
jgi:hypothetical protein